MVKNQGQSDIKFLHNFLGYNYRMTNLQASILYGQIKDIDLILEMKKNIFLEYERQMKNIQGISLPKQEKETINSNWMFGIRLLNFTLEEKKKKKKK